MQNILFLLLSIVTGGFTGWIIRELFFEKSHVSNADYKAVQDQLQAIKTEKALIEQSLDFSKEEKCKLERENEGMCKETENLRQALNNLTAEKATVASLLDQGKQQWQETKAALVDKEESLSIVSGQVANLQAQIDAKQEKLETQKSDLENIGKKLEDTFKVLAQNILEDKTKRFSDQQEQNLKGILQPLEKEIKEFKNEIERKQKVESDERISLREQVKNMSSLNQTLSDQANKLTETLRLQVKQQGDWGESILEAILENSGLQKDLQYFTQYSTRNDEGKMIHPDVIVKYPDDRKIIIDSKVSLVSYYNLCNAANETDEETCLKQLIQSVKGHIDDLDVKNYGDISQALDFIIMFVPVEPAYIAAMHGDSGLWQYAYKKGILLISPANLIATLRLIKDMWRKDSVDKNAQEIADKAGKLYDKLVSFVDTFERVGAQLEKTTETWGDARKQLTSGKGNLISQAMKMNTLRISSKKNLPDEIANEAILNDHFSISDKPAEELPLYE